MALWRDIADTIFRGIGSEARWRRENPCDTADMFRQREKFWRSRGRRVLGNIAGRRAERWDARCKAKRRNGRTHR